MGTKESHRIPRLIHPEIAFFAIGERDFVSDEGWRGLIDLLARHGMYNLLTVTMRVEGHAITEPTTHALFERLVEYARQQGLEVALDLDPRLARGEFRRRYPDEQQRIVYLQRCPLRNGSAEFEIEPERWSDHMTGNGTPYLVEKGQFVRAEARRLDAEGRVLPESRRDVGDLAEVCQADAEGVRGRVSEVREADELLVLAEFELFSPDAFSPHLLSYQRELLDAYAELPLGGVIKDEWGFPPTVKSIVEHRAFWYSRFYEEAYQRESGGRSLLDDLPLMATPVCGCEEERVAAINRYMMLNLHRQAEVEEDYYRATKECFGPDSLITKHATWYPRVNDMEIFKNGLSWWAARRDIAQTDEITPLSAALGMAKKFGSGNWLNEGYADRPELYRRNIWRYAVAGGRMVFHSLYPTVNGQPRDPADPHHSEHSLLLTRELLQAECRVRLLNLISTAPLDCPVAFLFGHEGVMNWAGAGYLDYGEELSLGLWRNGYAVDLYPTSEIVSGTFAITDDGQVRVGRQRYEMLVLHRPDLCPPEVAAFFSSGSIEKTSLVVVGDWKRDDRGYALDGLGLLPNGFRHLSPSPGVLTDLIVELQNRGVRKQPPLEEPYMLFNNDQIGMPAPRGISRLVDGTVVRIAATEISDGGDPIEETVEVDGVSFEVAAEGLFAVRVDDSGGVAAMATGGLRKLRGGGIALELAEPLDVALWQDEDGKWCGVIQGTADVETPAALKRLAQDWQRLSVPPPYPHPQS
ncbi:MAG: hypothetical protein HOC74_04670 [Gemmatimonadetes bacterium]|nr:hypothetical protein [Gemmatimonadota bacterium]